ncbi:MAG: folate family ECF transporter S component [Candidatus Izemoplasmatales bacterium]|nr:folate family ECF transporter S component [Candidatus Izemoplasmatales bacterium]
MRKKEVRKLIFTGLMVAIGVVLTYFLSITIPPSGSPIIRFGIGYLPLIVISILFGPIYGLMGGIAQDLLGIFLIGAPIFSYTFSPVYTLNAVLYGVVPGLFFRYTAKWSKRFFFVGNFVLLSLFLIVAGIYFFNLEYVISQTLGQTEKYLLLASGVFSALILGFLNIIVKRNPRYGDQGTKLLFVVMVLYMLVSLGTTPLQIAFVQAIPYWSLLPLRIVKMPIEVMAYLVLLVTILKLLRELTGENSQTEE